MTIVEFLIFFILFLLITSVAINGVFFASRPHEETRPDGKVLKNGKILQWWYYFWHTENGEPEKVYFQREQLACLISEMSGYYKGEITPFGEVRFIVNRNFLKQKTSLQNILDVCFDHEVHDETNGLILVRVHRSYPRYLFPEWVRDMMAACVTCHATVYGNVAFWLVISLIKEDAYAWSHSPVAALIVSWIAFWLCLAYVNTWLFQRVKL